MTMHSKSNWLAWGLAAILAVVVLGGIGTLGVWLRPYLVAKYRGEEADLHGAMLIYAPLRGANLQRANLHGADLQNASLAGANLENADLSRADLSHADFTGTMVSYADLRGANLCGADLGKADIGDPGQSFFHLRVDLTGAFYDEATAWPGDF